MATRKQFLINGLGMLALVLAAAAAALSISGQATARNGQDDEARARLRNPAGKVIARFNSVWRLEAPGTWRVIFDKGSPPSVQEAGQ